MEKFTVKDLIKFLQSVPSDYEVHIGDVNFDQSAWQVDHSEEFRVDSKTHRLYLPAVGQDYID